MAKVILGTFENIPEGFVRAYPLQNKDVISFYGVLFEWEDGIFYEVERVKLNDYIAYYKRTGAIMTPEEMNEISKGEVIV